jgi:hypothetical protein
MVFVSKFRFEWPIDFGKNDLKLLPLSGKYTCLGPGVFAFNKLFILIA